MSPTSIVQTWYVFLPWCYNEWKATLRKVIASDNTKTWNKPAFCAWGVLIKAGLATLSKSDIVEKTASICKISCRLIQNMAAESFFQAKAASSKTTKLNPQEGDYRLKGKHSGLETQSFGGQPGIQSPFGLVSLFLIAFYWEILSDNKAEV